MISVWIERGPGEVEQHVPLPRYALRKDGHPVVVDGYAIEDEKPSQEIMGVLGSLDGASGADAVKALQAVKSRNPRVQAAVRDVLTALEDCRQRTQKRQGLAERGVMRAPELAEYELAAMTLRVREG